ncbi:unnamed protein product [Leptidea sinapis]|uniref:Aldehyde dehydrogenase domain-containing protein n=1 Tax=Leptidea sinapis TaxID=189913 RepID=A0A5E4QL57_9NEOP|nr:unnamed protein product [Leptidea sinapis]
MLRGINRLNKLYSVKYSTAAAPAPNTNPDIFYTGLFINNEWVKSSDGKTFKTENPATGQVIAEVQQGGKADVDKAVKAAKDAFRLGSPWRTMDASHRGYLINKLADLAERDRTYLASLETLDNGKPFLASYYGDVASLIKNLRYYAGWADKNHGKTLPIDGKYFACVWPDHTMELPTADGIVEAGSRAGDWQHRDTQAGGADSSHRPLSSTTGEGRGERGARVGKLIQRGAAGSVKRITLELGGKSPNIVLADCDLQHALAKKRVLGDPFDPKTEQGPQMDIATVEIFGPVQQILKFSSLEEVVQRANDTEYGLAAAVFSQDVDRINYVIQVRFARRHGVG